MPKKRTSKPKKRSPKEERPKRLLKATEALNALKAEFDAAHVDGMRALKQRDFEGLARAIKRERDIIKRHEVHLGTRRKKTT